MSEQPSKFSRRDVLLQGLALPSTLQLLFTSGVHAATVGVVPFLDDKPNPSTITEHADKIIPFDLTRLTSWITPADHFYIRNHFAVPKRGNTRDWNIRVEGNVRHPERIAVEQLSTFPRVERIVTLECAGNSKRRNPGW